MHACMHTYLHSYIKTLHTLYTYIALHYITYNDKIASFAQTHALFEILKTQ